MMKPVVIDQIFDIEVNIIFEPDLAAGWKPIEWIVLKIFITESILPNELAILPLVFHFLP